MNDDLRTDGGIGKSQRPPRLARSCSLKAALLFALAELFVSVAPTRAAAALPGTNKFEFLDLTGAGRPARCPDLGAHHQQLRPPTALARGRRQPRVAAQPQHPARPEGSGSSARRHHPDARDRHSQSQPRGQFFRGPVHRCGLGEQPPGRPSKASLSLPRSSSATTRIGSRKSSWCNPFTKADASCRPSASPS